nr:Chain Q, Ssa1 [synthetic construct]
GADNGPTVEEVD